MATGHRAGRPRRRTRARLRIGLGISGVQGLYRAPAVGHAWQDGCVSIGRIAWLVTALLCVLAAVILLVSGYQGYAAVVLVVGASAAINLL